MATMGEIMKDPSKATDEDIKALKEIHELFNTFKDKMKPYEGISLNSGRTIKEIAKRFYQENLILSAILEAFVYKEKYRFSDLNKWVFNYVDNEFIWDVSIPYYNMCVAKLCNVGFLKAEFQDTSDNNPDLTITNHGRDALRQQTFANLAQSSLLNYQAGLSNEQSVKIESTNKMHYCGVCICRFRCTCGCNNCTLQTIIIISLYVFYCNTYMKLYHFTSFDTFVRIWLSKKLKFGSMLTVNDIQESMKGITISKPSHLPVMFAFKDLITQYKQISFSMDQNTSIKGYMNTMMWGYYADESRGVCIEFDCDNLTIPGNVLRSIVKYQDVPPRRTDIPDFITTIKELRAYIETELANLFFIKQTGWSGENEYRLVCNTLDFLDIEGAIDCVYLTSYDSDECKMVEMLVQDEVAVKYIHFLNGILTASETKRTRSQIEKVQKSPGVLKQLSDQAKEYYEEHKDNEDFSLALDKYILK